MLSRLIRLRWPIPVLALVAVLGVVGTAVATTRDDGRELVVYNGRSHYGDEQVFEDFEQATGIEVVLRGGTGPELYERLRREGGGPRFCRIGERHVRSLGYHMIVR